MSEAVVTTEVKPATETTVVTEEQKTVPYDRFKEIISKNKELEAKLIEVTNKIEAENKAAADKKAKEEGDYNSLIQKVTAEREAEKLKLNTMVRNTFLGQLATKNEILSDHYLKLFETQIEVDGLEIKNAKEAEEAFVKFRLDNPTLFKPMKEVPKTDSTPVKKVDNSLDPTKMSREDMWKAGFEEIRNKKK